MFLLNLIAFNLLILFNIITLEHNLDTYSRIQCQCVTEGWPFTTLALRLQLRRIRRNCSVMNGQTRVDSTLNVVRKLTHNGNKQTDKTTCDTHTRLITTINMRKENGRE